MADNIEGCARGFGECQAIGFERDGHLIAGVVYHNWVPENGVIELSAASTCRNWLTRANMAEIFGYPFYRIGCRMLVARIAESNKTARRIWRSLGSDEYVIPSLRSPQEAEIVYTLKREQFEQTFGEKINGKAKGSKAA